jgi:hypothetical protein
MIGSPEVRPTARLKLDGVPADWTTAVIVFRELSVISSQTALTAGMSLGQIRPSSPDGMATRAAVTAPHSLR